MAEFSFTLGAVALAFISGVLASELRIFPSQSVHDSIEAVGDWYRNWQHYFQLRSRYAMPTSLANGVTVHDRAAAYPGYTFITGYRDGAFKAFLIDMQGTMEHEWRIAFSDVWSDPPHLDIAPPDFDVAIHGAALLPDGAIVINFEGLGAVKLDRCSRVLWRVPAETHHSVDALPTGEFLIPARRRLSRREASLRGVRVAQGEWLWEDIIMRINPDGAILAAIPLLDQILASEVAPTLSASLANLRPGSSEDPLHLNDAEMLREDMAAAFPLFAAGDLLVSMRHLDTIAVLDRKTFSVKWWMRGPFLGQHDPDFLPNGRILLFDNHSAGESQEFGSSTIVEIDPASRKVLWIYAGSEEVPFYTSIRGKEQLLPNGNILVTEAQAGRVFEITPGGNRPRTVWEWVNRSGEGVAGLVTQADRVTTGRADFLRQPCPTR
jgi:hypothetical protein